jgi:hypothetical protein
MSVAQIVHPQSGGATWRRWLLSIARAPAMAEPMVEVTQCPGCGVTVAMPDRLRIERCDECGAALSVRADELDIELAVRSRLYGR